MKKHLLSLTLVLAFVVGACGGGGEGGTPSDGYTGKTTQATVTPTNGGTFSSSTVAMSTKLLPVASSSGSNLGKPNGGGGGIVQKIISMASDGLRASIPVSGPCGGSADVSLTTNMDGTKSAIIIYSKYNDCTDGTLTGTITLFGTKTNFTATMNLTGDDSSSSTANDYTHTYFMNVTFTGTDSLTTKTLNMTVTDMVQTIRGGDSSKMEDFVLTYSMDKSTMNYSTTMSGRLFDSTWGYVTVSTPVTLIGNGSGDPTAGTLRVLGVNNVGVEVQYTSTTPILYVNSAASPDTWTPA